MKQIFFFLIFLMFLSCSSDELPAAKEKGEFTNDWTYKVYNYDGVSKTAFRLCIPKDVKPRAILILTPGNVADGTNLVNLSKWQEFAKKERIALIGAYAKASSDIVTNNLFIALKKITAKHNIEYVEKLPFLLRGHSSGGRFSYEFASNNLKRTIAFANIKGGVAKSDFKLPPSLLIVGGEDLESRNKFITEAFYSQRESNAFSCLAIGKKGGHGVGNSDYLIQIFFSSILKERLLPNGELKDLEPKKFYLGNNNDMQVLLFDNYLDNKQEASCIIDEVYAKAWKEFIN